MRKEGWEKLTFSRFFMCKRGSLYGLTSTTKAKRDHKSASITESNGSSGDPSLHTS